MSLSMAGSRQHGGRCTRVRRPAGYRVRGSERSDEGTPMTDDALAEEAVSTAAGTARAGADALANAASKAIDVALRAMARRLLDAAEPLLAANRADQEAARTSGMSGGLLDRLRLDEDRLAAMAGQLHA